jgi:hypothetical protein
MTVLEALFAPPVNCETVLHFKEFPLFTRQPGKYQADYGELGSIEFELQK